MSEPAERGQSERLRASASGRLGPPSWEGELPAASEPGEEGFGADELRALLLSVKAHWALILAVVGLATAAAAVRTYRLPSVFAASARLQLAKEAPDPSVTRYMTYWEGIQQEYLNTQMAIIESHPLALQVLEDHPEIARQLEVDQVGEAPAADVTLDRDRLAWAFLSGVSVSPVKDTYLVDIHYTHTDKERCVPYANALAAAYMEQLDEQRGRKTRLAEEKIGEQASLLFQKLERSEQELRAFLDGGAPLFERHEELLIGRIASNNQSLSEVQQRRIRIEAELEAVARIQELGRPLETAPAIARDKTVTTLREELTRVEVDVAALAERYGDSWPAVVQARSRRDQLRLILHGEVERLRAGLQAERDQLVAEERGLQERARQLHDEARELSRRAHVYENLHAEVEANRRFYDEFADRLKELSHYAPLSVSNVRLVNRAMDPYQVSPNHQRNITLGVFFGLALALGLVFALERLSDRVRTPDDASRILGLPVLSVVPALTEVSGRDLDLYSLTRPHSHFAEAFRRLRVQLNASGAFPPGAGGVVALTSGLPKEGKTVASVGLALAWAQAGHRTLLLDADLRSPRVHQALGLAQGEGLADVLAGRSLWGAVVRAAEVPNLSVITAGQAGDNPAEQLAQGTGFAELLERLRHHFDRIVIDTPPAAVVADAPLIAPFADATLLVISAQTSSRRASRLAATELSRVSGPPLGLVFNMQRDALGGPYYGYGYGYVYGQPRRSSEAAKPAAPAGS